MKSGSKVSAPNAPRGPALCSLNSGLSFLSRAGIAQTDHFWFVVRETSSIGHFVLKSPGARGRRIIFDSDFFSLPLKLVMLQR